MLRIPRLFAFVFLSLICTLPAYSAQYLFHTVRIPNPADGSHLSPGMDGPSEPAASPGKGYGTALYDDVAHTLTLDAKFTGLVGNTTASHIHAPSNGGAFAGTAGVATTSPTFVGFPNGVKSGTFSSTLDLTQNSSWNPTYKTNFGGGTNAGAEAAFVASLFANTAYWNIHSQSFPGGEIRGFMTLIPEPASGALLAFGLMGFVGIARRRR